MPDWLPPLIHEGFPVVFSLFVCWALVQGVKAYWPVWQRKMDAEAKKTEAEAILADRIGETQQHLCKLMERAFETLDAHSEYFKSHGRQLKEVRVYLRDIHKRLSDADVPLMTEIDDEGSGEIEKGRQ